MLNFFVLLLILGFSGSVSVAIAAESTMTCHCFKDRNYDHQNPEKLSPYLLVTTQNSFLAVAFNASKFELVKDLMSGVSAERLWISHYFAAKSALTSKTLLLARDSKGSWWAALKELAATDESFPTRIVATLQVEDDDKQLAAAVVDETLLDVLQVDAGQLLELRLAGANNREVILGFFLAKRTGQKATEIYKSITDGATNWGTLIYINNVRYQKMEQEFKSLLNK